MTAIAESFFAPRRSPRGSSLGQRDRPLAEPEARLPSPAGPRGDRVELERLPPRQRAELGLPEPEPDVTRMLDRLRLR